MIVKTDNPVLYSNAFGGGAFRDKIKGFVEKAKGSGGLMDKAKGFLGGLGGGGQQQQQAPPPPPPPPPRPKGMSKGLKMGLIIGGSVLALAIIGVVIYKVSKNKSNG